MTFLGPIGKNSRNNNIWKNLEPKQLLNSDNVETNRVETLMIQLKIHAQKIFSLWNWKFSTWSNLIKSDQIWSNLIKSDQNIDFDQIWSDLIRFDQIWSGWKFSILNWKKVFRLNIFPLKDTTFGKVWMTWKQNALKYYSNLFQSLNPSSKKNICQSQFLNQFIFELLFYFYLNIHMYFYY